LQERLVLGALAVKLAIHRLINANQPVSGFIIRSDGLTTGNAMTKTVGEEMC